MPSTPQPVCSRSINTKSAPAAAAIRGMPSVWNSNTIVPNAVPPPARRERSVSPVIPSQPRLSTTVFSSVRRSMENRPPTRPTPLCEPARPPNGRCDSQ